MLVFLAYTFKRICGEIFLISTCYDVNKFNILIGTVNSNIRQQKSNLKIKLEADFTGKPMKKFFWIKPVTCEYSCNEEYLEEFNKGNLKILLITSCTPMKQT